MPVILEEGLVSIISPCYNVSKYLPKFLDSLLQQTYGKLHVILVNDGSTDHTLDVIRQYVPSLKDRGYLVDVVDQENRGLAGAIQSGLGYVKGEFLTWPDPDDWLYPASVQRRVDILKQSDHDVALLKCNANIFREDDGSMTGSFLPPSNQLITMDNYFNDLLLRQTFFAPLCSMLKTHQLMEANSDLSIYVQQNAGQNWQLLLPVTRVFKTLQSYEVLGGYLVRQESHSRIQSSYEERVKYEDMCDTVVRETLARMGLAGSTWAKKAHALSLIHQYRIALRYGKDPEARLCLSELKGQGFSPRCVAWMYAFCAKLGKYRWNDNPESYLNRFLARVGVDCLPPY